MDCAAVLGLCRSGKRELKGGENLLKQTYYLQLLVTAVENVVDAYDIVEEPDFNSDIQREIQKIAMKTGESVLFETEINAELMSLNYKLGHLNRVESIINDMKEEIEGKRTELIDELNLDIEKEVRNAKNKK
jgi:hypothetical protein